MDCFAADTKTRTLPSAVIFSGAKSTPQIIEHLWGIKVCVCKYCGGHMIDHHRQLPMIS